MDRANETIFREIALKDYMAGREASVLPSFTRGYFTNTLWIIACTVLLSAFAILTFVEVDRYQGTVAIVSQQDSGISIAVPSVDDQAAPSHLLIIHEAGENALPMDLTDETPSRMASSSAVPELTGVPMAESEAEDAFGDELSVFDIQDGPREHATSALPSGVYVAYETSSTTPLWRLLLEAGTANGAT